MASLVEMDANGMRWTTLVKLRGIVGRPTARIAIPLAGDIARSGSSFRFEQVLSTVMSTGDWPNSVS